MQEELLNIIQKYRHDVANQLQLVSGYLSMDRIEKVEEKIEQWTALLEKERKLYFLNIPKTTLWILKFNLKYDSIRLDYNISLEEQISLHDELIYNCLQKLMTHIKQILQPLVLYNVLLTFKKTNEGKIYVSYEIAGELNDFKDIKQIKNFPLALNVEANKEKIVYSFELM